MKTFIVLSLICSASPSLAAENAEKAVERAVPPARIEKEPTRHPETIQVNPVRAKDLRKVNLDKSDDEEIDNLQVQD